MHVPHGVLYRDGEWVITLLLPQRAVSLLRPTHPANLDSENRLNLVFFLKKSTSESERRANLPTLAG